MTDHPRFQPPKGPFEAAYGEHHGGRLVHLVMRLVGPRKRPSGNGASHPMLPFELLDGEQSPAPPRRRRSAVQAAVIAVFVILFSSVQILTAWKRMGGSPDRIVTTSARPGPQ
jgi:hypothetical protein